MEKFVQIESVVQTFDTKKGKFVALRARSEYRYLAVGKVLELGGVDKCLFVHLQ